MSVEGTNETEHRVKPPATEGSAAWAAPARRISILYIKYEIFRTQYFEIVLTLQIIIHYLI